MRSPRSFPRSPSGRARIGEAELRACQDEIRNLVEQFYPMTQAEVSRRILERSSTFLSGIMSKSTGTRSPSSFHGTILQLKRALEARYGDAGHSVTMTRRGTEAVEEANSAPAKKDDTPQIEQDMTTTAHSHGMLASLVHTQIEEMKLVVQKLYADLVALQECADEG